MRNSHIPLLIGTYAGLELEGLEGLDELGPELETPEEPPEEEFEDLDVVADAEGLGLVEAAEGVELPAGVELLTGVTVDKLTP